MRFYHNFVYFVPPLCVSGSGFERTRAQMVHAEIRRCLTSSHRDSFADSDFGSHKKVAGPVSFSKSENIRMTVSDDGRVLRLKKTACPISVGLGWLGWEEVKSLNPAVFKYFEIRPLVPIDLPRLRVDRTLQYEVIGDLLNELERIHAMGLKMSPWGREEEWIGFSGDIAKFRLQFFELDTYLLKLDSEIMEPIYTRRSYKKDLLRIVRLIRPRNIGHGSKFFHHVRSLPDWEDPLLMLEDAVSKAGDSFDYAHWSDFFKQLSKLEEEEVRDRVRHFWDARIPDPRIRHPATSDEYWPLFRECMADFGEVECWNPRLFQQCIIPEMFTYDSGTATAELFIDANIGSTQQGISGFAYPSADGTKYLKVSKHACGLEDPLEPYFGQSEERKEQLRGEFRLQSKIKQKESIISVCTERSILRVLDGLNGVVPKEYPLKSEAQPLCAKMSILTESAGRYSLGAILPELTMSQIFSVAARIIALLRDLNMAGFIQNDLHFGNVFFSDLNDIAGTLKLIDFGFAVPITDESGRLTFAEGCANLVQVDFTQLADNLLTELMLRTSKQMPKEYIEMIRGPIEGFYGAIDSLGVFESPDYNKWIVVFESLAQTVAKIPGYS